MSYYLALIENVDSLFVPENIIIEVFPNWDYTNADKKIQSEHRTSGGKYYRYVWGNYKEFKFSLNFVNFSDATVINSWWGGDKKLLFGVASGDAFSIISSVMIMEDDTPLSAFEKPYETYYKGKLILSTY